MNKEFFESKIGESYTKLTHPSGLTIYVCEKKDYSSCYALFGTRYGSIDTFFSADGGKNFTSVPEGIAHFLEHKLFESEDGDAFTRYAETGASANAFTSFDRTCYLFSCGERFYDNLEILLDFVQHPYFTEQTVLKEQGIIGQEIRMYDDSPNWCVLFNMLRNMYQKHPVRIDIAGTTESIAQITDKLLYECYNTFYNPSNMFLCVAGNVSAEKIIEQTGAALCQREPIELVRGEHDEPIEVLNNYTEAFLPVSIPMFCLGFKQQIDTPLRSLKERIAMSLALEVLAGDSSPLYKELTDRELINDEFETEYFTGHGYAAVLFSGESVDPKQVRDEILKELKRITENGFEKDLLETVRRATYGDAVRRFNNVESIAMQLVECAMFDYNLFSELEIIGQIGYDDIIECLNKLKEEYCVLSVIQPKDKE